MTKIVFQGAKLAGVSALALACGAVDPSQSEEDNLAEAQSTLVTAAAADTSSRFFVPPPDPEAVKQVAALLKGRDLVNAARLAAMVTTPQAVWFTGGSAADVEASVKKTMKQAALEQRVPVLVSYNVPFRDCAQYSSGGAVDTTAYEAWIDGFAKGIGSGKAVVILEPDSLGIIPYNTTIFEAEE